MDPLEPVRFVKHGCVCFESDDAVVYVDPYKVPDLSLIHISEPTRH